MNRHSNGKAWVRVGALGAAMTIVAGIVAAQGFPSATTAETIGWLQAGSSYQALHVLILLLGTSLMDTRWIGKKLVLVTPWLRLAAGILFACVLLALLSGGRLWLGTSSS